MTGRVRLLGIDTSSPYLSVAVLEGATAGTGASAGVGEPRAAGDRVLADLTERADRQHVNRLSGAVRQVCEQARLTLAQLDGIAVGIGPGSFAGLRIGLTTAKMLALALSKPILGASSLEAMAWNHREQPGCVCVLVDAKRRQVYASRYRADADGMRCESDARLSSIESALEPLRALREPVIVVGDAVSLYQEHIRQALGDMAQYAEEGADIPRAEHVARIALRRWRHGERDDLDALSPVYMYPPPVTLRKQGMA